MKVDLCHQTGAGLRPLAVNGNAVLAHLAHSDLLQPNAPAPEGQGSVLDASCLDGNNLIVGSGIPAIDMGVARNEAAEIELAFGIIYRQGPNVASSDVDGYGDGVLHFSVASGPQSTANGSFANDATRAAWSFNYSIATGINGPGGPGAGSVPLASAPRRRYKMCLRFRSPSACRGIPYILNRCSSGTRGRLRPTRRNTASRSTRP